MIVLCLFVVLAALFITVLNSKTANSLRFGDKTAERLINMKDSSGS